MKRSYHVQIRDNDTGRLVLDFKGTVVRKEQQKGHLGTGEVEETLYTTDYRLRRGSAMRRAQHVSGGMSLGLDAGEVKQAIRDRAARARVAIDPDWQLQKGIEVEMEHTSSKRIAKRIALDHLVEYPDYYTALEKMERQLESKWEGK